MKKTIMLFVYILALAARAQLASDPSDAWLGYQRDNIGFDTATGEFTNTNFPSIAKLVVMTNTLDAIDEILHTAAVCCSNVSNRAAELVAAEGERPVILLTADYDMLDALNRRNLTMVVPSWSFNPSNRQVTAMVFTTSILASPPKVEARITSAIDGTTKKVTCRWIGYGEEENAVEIQVGGNPDNRFECYPLIFTLPEEFDLKSVDFSQWGRIGDPESGFNVGNRQYRVNGELTFTSSPSNTINSIFDFGTVEVVGNENIDLSIFDFFTDNGLTKAALKEETEE